VTYDCAGAGGGLVLARRAFALHSQNQRPGLAGEVGEVCPVQLDSAETAKEQQRDNSPVSRTDRRVVVAWQVEQPHGLIVGERVSAVVSAVGSSAGPEPGARVDRDLPGKQQESAPVPHASQPDPHGGEPVAGLGLGLAPLVNLPAIRETLSRDSQQPIDAAAVGRRRVGREVSAACPCFEIREPGQNGHAPRIVDHRGEVGRCRRYESFTHSSPLQSPIIAITGDN
jgi:hypothetical protein